MGVTAGRTNEPITITAENEFTDPLGIRKGERFTVSIAGTFSATVHFQRRLDGASWRTAETFTAAAERDGIAAENMEIRLGVPTGAFSSGAVECRVGK